ncbi:MAG TPA: SGNH/GDSL hydrolase family protein, partial [Chloroflexota bacterium]|nr:SGNH/GDSL hydrolase family protein [Chloroflexota bacterium]
MRVLFVGNSYVFFNDLPGLLTSLARAGGVALDAESVVEGGMTLLGHLRNGAAVARIRAGGWDAVVLQEQSTRPLRAPALLRLTARRLAEESRRAGARPILFLTWARRDDGRQQRALDLALAGTAQAIGAGLAPVGPAWQRVLTERPDLVLHAADGSHPAPAGTYLAACVFFAVLTG